MRRRSWKLFGTLAAGAITLLGAGAFALWPRPSEALESAQRTTRIHAGMNRQEVEAILGPPGDRRTGPTEYPTGYRGRDTLTMREALWEDDAGMLVVKFDRSGKVESKEYSAAFVPEKGLLWRLKRQWRRWFP